MRAYIYYSSYYTLIYGKILDVKGPVLDFFFCQTVNDQVDLQHPWLTWPVRANPAWAPSSPTPRKIRANRCSKFPPRSYEFSRRNSRFLLFLLGSNSIQRSIRPDSLVVGVAMTVSTVFTLA